MFGCARALASSASWMALPVASAACAMRRTAWPPSRVRCRPSGPPDRPKTARPARAATPPPGAVLGDEAGRVLVDQAGTGILGVAHVRIDAVVVAEHADDAALRPGRRAFVEPTFGQHHHLAMGATCNATARPARPAPMMTTGAGPAVWEASVMQRLRLGEAHSTKPVAANRCTFAGGRACRNSHPRARTRPYTRLRHCKRPDPQPGPLPPNSRHRNVRHPARQPPPGRNRRPCQPVFGRPRHRTAVAGHADRRRRRPLPRQRQHRDRPAHRRRPVGNVRGVPAG